MRAAAAAPLRRVLRHAASSFSSSPPLPSQSESRALLDAALACASAEVASLRGRLGAPCAPLRVAVGLSGGVDSAVALALLARLPGISLRPVFARTWDGEDEEESVDVGGGGGCMQRADEASATAVASSLGLELAVADLRGAYWTRVWTPFVERVGTGVATPNPDLDCNRHVKFGALADWAAQRLGAAAMATGHYARIRAGLGGDRTTAVPRSAPQRSASIPLHMPCPARLFAGVDPAKDQSYFLASVGGRSLSRAVCPLGGLTKAAVKRLVPLLGLPPQLLTRRSSAGICFVGKRDFGPFVEQYFPHPSSPAPLPSALLPRPESVSSPPFLGGAFVDVDTCSVIGRHPGAHALTIGQRAGISGSTSPYFVVGKGASSRGDGADAMSRDIDVWVAKGPTHPALFSRFATADSLRWVCDDGGDSCGGGGGGGGGSGSGGGFCGGSSAPPLPHPLLSRLSSPLGVRVAARHRHGGEAAAATAWLLPPCLAPAAASSSSTAAGSSNDGDDWACDAQWARGRPARCGGCAASRASSCADVCSDGVLRVAFDAPQRALSPGQALVLYAPAGGECIGSGVVAHVGRSEAGRAERVRAEGDTTQTQSAMQ